MRAIILAAGNTSRLLPPTEEFPKCLVPLRGRTLIDYQLQSLDECGITDVTVVTGFRCEQLESRGLKCKILPDFEHTHMVNALTAVGELDDELIVTNGDIVFEPRILRALIRTSEDIAVSIDRGWKDLWNLRKETPVTDAGSLKLRPDGTICEIGGKASSYADIQGQYMGLMRFSRLGIKKLLDRYRSLDPQATYEGKSHRHMFMTSLLDRLAKDQPIRAVQVNHGWLEVDTISDLKRYEKLRSVGDSIFDFSVFNPAIAPAPRESRDPSLQGRRRPREMEQV